MAGIFLAHGHHRHAVGAALRRQVEIDNLGKLLLQERHKDLVERYSQHRRFIRRTAGIGAVVNRGLAMGYRRDGEYREAFHLVVIAGMVAERPFLGGLAGLEVALENVFSVGRYSEAVLTAQRRQALGDLGFTAAQQTREGVLGDSVGYGCDGGQGRGGIRAQGYGHGVALPRMLQLPIAKIECAAAMGQPAHDELVAPDQLHAVDAEIEALLAGATGDDQGPGDQRARIAGPAGLYRQLVQVDLVTLLSVILAAGVAHHFWCHVQHLFQHWRLAPGIAHTLGRIGLAQVGQQFPDLAQRGNIFPAHAQRDPLFCAEQVDQYGRAIAPGVLEQQGGATAPQGAVGDFGHFQHRVHFCTDADQLAALFQLGDKIP